MIRIQETTILLLSLSRKETRYLQPLQYIICEVDDILYR